MYLSGVGGTERLWIYEFPGSPNCPANLKNGCYNTGQSPGCGDPQQFDTFESMSAYADARGEQKRQVSSAEEAFKICKPTQIPAPAPIQAGIQAPGYSNPGYTASGARILPTGVATQGAPQIITVPGTQTTLVVPGETPDVEVQAAGLDWLPLVVGGSFLAYLFTKKGRRS